jgi:serine/threonine protein phosphatase PrpC
MSNIELHYGATTDVGLVREVNEDSFLADPPVFVVADGMGGHEGGDVASAIVVEEFAALAGQDYDVRTGAEKIAATLGVCQRRIAEYGARQEGARRRRWYAGTTAVVALLVHDEDGPRWLVANLGDSRAYRLGPDGLERVSVDHSLVQELVNAGRISEAEAATHPERHVITRALGGPDLAEADYFHLPLASAARLLLCSDGVTGMLDDAAVEAILDETDDPREAADGLVGAAVSAGGEDNATAVVVDVVGWAADSADDSRGQRESQEDELGAVP